MARNDGVLGASTRDLPVHKTTDPEMIELHRRRGVIKGRLTRAANYIFGDQAVSRSEIKIRKEALSQLFNEFCAIQDVVESKQPDSQAEADERSNFEDEIFRVQAAYEDRIENGERAMPNLQQHPQAAGCQQRTLPCLELPKFDGQIGNWYTFSETFRSLVHNNTRLDSIQKFHYLKSCLVGKSSEILESLAITGENYGIAWETLTKRFSNKKVLVNHHLKELLRQPVLKKESHSDLRNLLDNFKKHIKTLNALEVPTDHWDTILIHLLLERCDCETRKLWDTSLVGDNLPTWIQLENFLENRCYVLSNSVSERTIFPVRDNKILHNRSQSHFSNSFSDSGSCRLCKAKHPLVKCDKFLKMNARERVVIIEKSKLCFKCFKSDHGTLSCPKNFVCFKCNSPHHRLLHIEKENDDERQMKNQAKLSEMQSCHSQARAGISKQVLLATAWVNVKDNSGNLHRCRALLDSGSQSNFITRGFASKLNLPLKKSNVQVSGIDGVSRNSPFKVNCSVSSPIHTFNEGMDCLVLDKITSHLPTTHIDASEWKFLKNYNLADPNFNIPGPIDLLVGAEFFEEIRQNGFYKSSDALPILNNTVFGWTVSGKIIEKKHAGFNLVTTCTSTIELSNQIRKFWEIEECVEPMNHCNDACETHFITTSQRRPDGRFVLELPFCQPDNAVLGNSFVIAKRRFLNQERRMNVDTRFREQYHSVMKEYIDMKHLVKVPENELEVEESTSCYLPHHAVVKESSNTTKLRVVFDGSCKTSSGLSLNDILLCGPQLQEDLFNVLIRFRCHKIAFVADIAKMYRMIDLNPKHLNYQRVLWRFSPDEPLAEYYFTTVMFGLKPSSFMATRCLIELGKQYEDEFPLATNIIRRDIYVDNVVSGADDIEEAILLQGQLTTIMESGNFTLREWCSNHPCLLQDLPVSLVDSRVRFDGENDAIKTLGLTWHPENDSFNFNPVINAKRITKRVVLSEISKIFDPLGLISPVTVRAKTVMQKIWLNKTDWDEELDENIVRIWSEFLKELNSFEQFSIPRLVLSSEKPAKYFLHIFCDASKIAYGAVAYISSRTDQGISTHLLCSKTRVAPLKVVTIPRLELCGAQLAAKLTSKLIKILNIKIELVYFWCDSQVVLHWLMTPPRDLNVFVSNRVSEITDLLKNVPHRWSYVKSRENPADLASRESSVSNLRENRLWWNGPAWLKFDSENYPKHNFKGKLSANSLEMRKMRSNVFMTVTDFTLLDRYSSYDKLIRVVGMIHYFRNKATNRSNFFGTREYQAARVTIVRMHQARWFTDEISCMRQGKPVSRSSQLLPLNPFLDANGLIRVGGRIETATMSFEKKHPYVLSGKCLFTEILIRYHHLKYLHAPPTLLSTILRETYWILRGKNQIKKCVRQCLTCFRLEEKMATQQMGVLPSSRTNPSKPFTHTGLDFAGPFLLKKYKGRCNSLEKNYICIFVCFSTRAIHLELVSDLSEDAFIACLKRFIGRRGRPYEIQSDNGRNFIGAKNTFDDFRKIFGQENVAKRIERFTSDECIRWRTLPAYSPHMGGLWEAGVKSVKTHLKAVLGDQRLTFEEFYTLLVGVESCLNSRPLTELSDDPNDLFPLTPSHFLIGEFMQALPEPDLDLNVQKLSKRWNRIASMYQNFWKRWSRDYLARLQTRTKWHLKSRNFEINELVLIKSDHVSPLKWPIGGIVALHTGRDGLVRVVSLKTRMGIIQRNINKLSLLPLNLESERSTGGVCKDFTLDTAASMMPVQGNGYPSVGI